MIFAEELTPKQYEKAMEKLKRRVAKAEREKAICEAYIGGKSLRELGREFYYCETNIRRILIKHGIDRRKCGRKRVGK